MKEAWSKVQSQYQRRADLIPNLVNTVKGAADFEKSTLTEVVQARANATSVKIDPTKLTESNVAAYQKAQDGLSSALSRLMVVVEKYPDLKANQNFLALQSQLEGTENRITVARQDYNNVAKSFNQTLVVFPNNVLAGMFNIKTAEFFQATQGAETAPRVNFAN